MTEDTPQHEKDILPVSTPTERNLEIASAFATFTPLLGGVFSNVLSGIATDRQFERVREFVLRLSARLDELSAEQEEYVRTEDFQEIVGETMRRVWSERSEEKRRAYGDFLLGIIESPGGDYDEQLEFLRLVEQLHPDFIRFIEAMRQPRPPDHDSTMGGPIVALHERLPDLSDDRLREIADRLNAMGLTSLPSLGTIMSRVPDLNAYFSPMGHRFVSFLVDRDES